MMTSTEKRDVAYALSLKGYATGMIFMADLEQELAAQGLVIVSAPKKEGVPEHCFCANCAAGNIQSIAGPGCSLAAHEYTEVNDTRCWNCGAEKKGINHV